MPQDNNKRIEFGDFQTPIDLAVAVCNHLASIGVRPDYVVEPTCGVGAFVKAALQVFDEANIFLAFEINASYLDVLEEDLREHPARNKVRLSRADFFLTNFQAETEGMDRNILVLGNFPWVTNSTQCSIGGTNLTQKSNFLGHGGFEAISGKANFDISEWMLLDVLRWLDGKCGTIAMLVKTSVARKVMAHVEKDGRKVIDARVVHIDAKRHFDASVDACLLVIRLSPDGMPKYDYKVFSGLDDVVGRTVGHRAGLTISNLENFESTKSLLGQSPQKWRSGIKHDASAIMEFERRGDVLVNGLGEHCALEYDYLYPLLKGSDVGSGKPWREKYVLVTQRRVGEETDSIAHIAPATWKYLKSHAEKLDGRGSSIYAKNPRYSIFGVGDYAFLPWRIAICSLYKKLSFRLVSPIEGKPAMFDDTVYYISFETEGEAKSVLSVLESKTGIEFLSSLIFWDEKRPIKTAILNSLDWRKV